MEAESSDINLDNSRSRAILIVTSIFLGLSLVSVILRCFVRTRIVRAFGWDDGVMVVAMVSYTSSFRDQSLISTYTGAQLGLRDLWNHRMQIWIGQNVSLFFPTRKGK
jgi:hypothetical protein